MNQAVFGDLAVLVDEHLSAVVRFDGQLSHGSMIEAADVAGRIARGLSGYLADLASLGVIEAITSAGLDDWTRAVVGAREGLRMAATSLRDSDVAAGQLEGEHGPVIAHLEAAAAALVAGRDLLQTHFHTDLEGLRVQRSDWAAVIASRQVTAVLLQKVDNWSRQLAFSVARVSLAAPKGVTVSVPVQKRLADACHYLLTVGAILAAAQRPVATADVHLLEAVPADVIAFRRPLQDGEQVDTLAAGIAQSAARLRTIACAPNDHAAWSPAITADSWRWTAATTAVTFHISGLILTTLADHPDLGTTLPAVGAELRAAADSATRAWKTWLATAAPWVKVTTETKGLTAPAIIDGSDLVVRFGRLAFQDPAWTPARRKSSAPREAASLAPDAAQFTVVIDAIHRGIDALARVGACDQHAIKVAIRAGRLQMPFRSNDGEGVRFRFGRVTPRTAAALQRAYAAAVRSAEAAVATLDVLATKAGASSRVLATAHQASRPSAATGQARAIGSEALVGTVADDSLGWLWPGGLERTVRHLYAQDPVLHLRARAIDTAARALIAEAKAASQYHCGQGPVPDVVSAPTSGHQAQVASVNFPANDASRGGPQETKSIASRAFPAAATHTRSPCT